MKSKCSRQIIRTSIDSKFINLFFVALIAGTVITSCQKKKETTISKNSNATLNETHSAISPYFTIPNALDTLKKTNLTYSIEQLDNTNGLSNSSINTIFQDSENLIWIGTWDGLNRYDGHNFKIFSPELNNENSLSNQVVLKIHEDSKRDIWVLTMHGLNRYDKRSNLTSDFLY